jgi:type I restriction enzyme S subunit
MRYLQGVECMRPKWPMKKLGDICEIIAGQAPPSKFYNDEGKGIPFLTVNSFGTIYPKVERWTTKCLRESSEGDVLFSVAGSLGLVNLGINACITRSIFALRPMNHIVLQKFLFYALKKYGSQIALMGSGTAQKVITIKQISDFEIPLPPLPIQQKIVKILDTIQEAVDIYDKIIEKTKELKKSLMGDLFKYGAPSFRRGRKLKKTEIGEIPEDWGVVRLGKVLKLSSGKSRPSQISNNQTEKMPYPVYGGNGIIGYSDKFIITHPTIVIGRVGEYCGAVYKTQNFAWITDNALYATDIELQKIDLDFSVHYFNYLNLNKFKKKSGQPLLTQTIIYSISLPLPPLPEQQEIAEILQIIDQKIEIEKRKKELYEELFKTMLNKIINQEVEVENFEV